MEWVFFILIVMFVAAKILNALANYFNRLHLQTFAAQQRRARKTNQKEGRRS